MKLTIDPEFKALIPPLSDEEYSQLEANLKAEGCRDPLVMWDGVIIDGHNRFELCTIHGIAFEKINKQFSDRSEVIEWIIRNQFGRRNLSDYNRSKLALRLKESLAMRAKENQIERKGGQSGNFDNVVKVDSINTRAEIAKAAGVSEGQISKVEAIERKATPEVKAALAKEEISINKAYQTTREPKEEPEPLVVDGTHNEEAQGVAEPGVALVYARTALDALNKIPKRDPSRAKAISMIDEWVKQNTKQK